MKSLVVYSSRTGNTRKVAEAVAQALPGSSLHSVEEAPDPRGFDLVAVGYWVNRGLPDAAAQKYMERIAGCKVALFGTLGAWPHSEHAARCKVQGEALLTEPQRGNTVLGTFLCQGRVDPAVVGMMQKMAGNVHPMTEERRLRLEEAARHPDDEDCRRAREMFAAIARTLCEEQAAAPAQETI